MIKMFLTLFLVLGSSVSVIATEKYTISVCMTSNLENALFCKKRIFDNMDGKVFIVKDKDEKYYTYLDIFDNKNDAKIKINKVSPYVKQQNPYIKEISQEIVALYSKKKKFIDLSEKEIKSNIQEVLVMKEKEQNVQEEKKSKKEENKERIQFVSRTPSIEQLEFVSSYPFEEGQKLSEDYYFQDSSETREEIKQISMDEFDKADDEKQAEEQAKKLVEKVKKQEVIENKKVLVNNQTIEKVEKKIEKKEMLEIVVNNPENEPTIFNYDELIIEVDANTNIMRIDAKINNKLKEIKKYRVSTAKKDVKRPFGEGKISKISLNPIWYPTQDTLKSFRNRGIDLPSVVPPGHRYNYMGAAKINLTHIVDGKSTFRIHGTLSEKTIGSNESAGCIRMKNSDVLQLATLINDFSQIKSLDKVKVILK
jgi:lipoprotein-anchoring transpeptidase ErfK/SrfK